MPSSIPISASFKNRDTTSRTLLARFVIRNIVTKVSTYIYSDTLLHVPGGTSVDTTFPDYVTNPNILSQLGSFLACASITAIDSQGVPIPDWAFADSSSI